MDKFDESVHLSIEASNSSTRPTTNNDPGDPSAPSWDFIDVNTMKKKEIKVEIERPVLPGVEMLLEDFGVDLVKEESMLLRKELKEEIVIKEEFPIINDEISRTSPNLDSSTKFGLSKRSSHQTTITTNSLYGNIAANSDEEKISDGEEVLEREFVHSGSSISDTESNEEFLPTSTFMSNIDKETLVSPPIPKRRKLLIKKRMDPIWKKVDDLKLLGESPAFEDDVQLQNNDEESISPYYFFKNFIDDDFLDIVVEQSNLYSVRKNVNCPLELSRNEFEQWLGLSMWFSLYKIGDTRLHWNEAMKEECVTSLMTRDRWEQIKMCIHLVDNNKLNGEDEMGKIRPFVNHLREKFRKIPMGRDLCIGKSIIPLIDKSSLEQRMSKKPHKWEFQLFILCDKDGIVYDFIPYTCKINKVDDTGVPDLGASSNIILNLAQIIPKHKGYRLFFDDWFTSLPLQTYLAQNGIWSCGTVQAKRLHGLSFSPDKVLAAKGRGVCEEWDTYVDGVRTTAVKWYDTRVVHTLSTFARARPFVEKEKYDYKDKKRVIVNVPNIVNEYNKAMGGVDLHDQMISLYRFSFKSKKYYMKIVFHLFDMALVNGWMMYKRVCKSMGIPKNNINKLSQFKIRVANSLMHSGKIDLKRSGLSNSNIKPPKRISNHGLPLPEEEIRYDHLDHLPKVGPIRHMCKNVGCKSRITTFCIKCNIYLCISQKRNCFIDFHTK